MKDVPTKKLITHCWRQIYLLNENTYSTCITKKQRPFLENNEEIIKFQVWYTTGKIMLGCK